jgi:putative nucleotidyltransferase with HDIG domain
VSQPTRKETIQADSPRVVLAVPDGEWSDELASAFSRAGYLPHRTPSPEATTLALSYREPAALVLDATFIRSAGFRMLDGLRIAAPGVPVLVTAEASEEQLRLKALVLGAEDCIVRPFAGQEAVIRVRRLIERREAARRVHEESRNATTQAEAFKRDALVLRSRLHRNVALLQRAVEFHQRLDPVGDGPALREAFLRHLGAQLSVERAALLAPAHHESSWLSARAFWGLPERLVSRVRIQASGELAALLEGTGAPMVVDRAARMPGLRLEIGILAAAGFTAAIPLLLKGRLLGVVVLGEAQGGGAPGEEVLGLGQFLASALVPLLAAQERWERERHLSAHTLGLLVAQLEARDPYLRGHSQRVSHLAEDLGQRLGFSEADLSRLTVAGLLHDIGRFEVDVTLWSKETPLTPDDWRLIRRHPDEGARILAEAAWPEPILEAVRHHHERWDGSGYPAGLSGEAIPLPARILAVADSLEALTSPRAYRPARGYSDALRVLRSEAGTKLDPTLVEAALAEAVARA